MRRTRRPGFVRLYFEPLEDRLTPAQTSVSGGVLTIVLDVNGESASVQHLPGAPFNMLSITSTSPISGGSSFVSAGITKINVSGQVIANTYTFTFAGGIPYSGGIASHDVENVIVNMTLLTGAAGVDIDALRRLEIGSGATITSTTGAIVLKGNQDATNSPNAIGVSISGIVVSDSGAISIAGQSGISAGDQNIGVRISGTVASTSGNVSITGDSDAPSSSTVAGNYGIHLTGGDVTTNGSGTVTLTGLGGNASGSNNYGILLDTAATVATAAANIVVTGDGGGLNSPTTPSNFNMGVNILGGSSITSGGAGTVTITGEGGPTADGDFNYGVNVQGAGCLITSGSTGAVTVNATGGGTGAGSSANTGIRLSANGSIKSGGSGTVTLSAFGGSNSGATGSGITLADDSPVTTGGGAITVSATPSMFVGLNAIVSVGAATITVNTNSLDLGTTLAGTHINGNGNVVTIRNRTVGIPIDLGGADTTGSKLGLTNIELGHISASVLRIGRNDALTSSGITISAAIAPTSTATLSLRTGGGLIANNTLTVGSLAIQAGTDIGLDNTIQNVGTLAGRSTNGSFRFNDLDAITIGSVDGLDGLSATAAAGEVYVYTSRNIVVSKNITAGGGTNGIQLLANTQTVKTAGNFHGIEINAATLDSGVGPLIINAFTGDASDLHGVYLHGTSTLTSSGGNVSVTGTSRGTTGAVNTGVLVDAGVTITSGASGTVSVTGTGGPSPANANYGVYVVGTNATITSSSGPVSVTGQGGGTGASSTNYGVVIQPGGTITAGGSGSVSVTGTGGNTSGNSNYGVSVNSASATITSGGGPVFVNGFGGGTGSLEHGVYLDTGAQITSTGSGAVTVAGQGAISPGTSNIGVRAIDANTRITSSGGAVSVTGTGGGTGAASNNNFGIELRAGARITTAGAIAVVGQGGVASKDGADIGIYLRNTDSGVYGLGGNVSVSGTGGGSGPFGGNDGVQIIGPAGIHAAGSGTLTVQGTGGTLSSGLNITGPVSVAAADLKLIGIPGAGPVSTSLTGIRLTSTAQLLGAAGKDTTLQADSIHIATTGIALTGSNSITIRPQSAGIPVNLGGTDSSGALGLTDAELDLVNAGILQVGHSAGGSVEVRADITRTTATQVTLTSNSDVLFNGGQFDTKDSTLVLQSLLGSVKPEQAGVDATASTALFTAGADLAIAINGTAVDTQYSQLNVAGTINLTGVDLVLSGSFVPSFASIYTIVNATTRIGEFNGLADNAVIPFNGRQLRLNYTATGATLTTLVSISGVVVNQGNLQRSRLESIALTFDAPVNAASFALPGAVSLQRTAGGNTDTVVNASNGLIVSPASGVVSTIFLLFTNADNDGVNTGSLADGRWQISIPLLNYTSPLNDTNLRRLFGDINGDGTVNGATDFAQFGNVFGVTVASPFDFNNDGTIDGPNDFAAFGGRFGVTL